MNDRKSKNIRKATMSGVIKIEKVKILVTIKKGKVKKNGKKQKRRKKDGHKDDVIHKKERI